MYSPARETVLPFQLQSFNIFLVNESVMLPAWLTFGWRRMANLQQSGGREFWIDIYLQDLMFLSGFQTPTCSTNPLSGQPPFCQNRMSANKPTTIFLFKEQTKVRFKASRQHIYIPGCPSKYVLATFKEDSLNTTPQKTATLELRNVFIHYCRPVPLSRCCAPVWSQPHLYHYPSLPREERCWRGHSYLGTSVGISEGPSEYDLFACTKAKTKLGNTHHGDRKSILYRPWSTTNRWHRHSHGTRSSQVGQDRW